MITLDAQIRCVKREIAMRRVVYPKWITRGKIDQAKADREIEVMEAVLKTLEVLAGETLDLESADSNKEET